MIHAFQWDLARQVERLDVLLRLLPQYAKWGYKELYLHLEDAVEYPSLPGIARADAYSYPQLKRLVAAATRVGIGVVPIVNLLGHTQYLIKVPELRDLNELRAENGTPLDQGQLCPLHPKTPEVAERLLRDIKPFCTAGKVHVGLDESFHLGKCPRCRSEIAEHGLAFHFAQHVHRLHRLTGSLGLRLGLWADMLNFVPDAIPQLPKGIIAYDWYYYKFRRHPRVELFNFAESDLATPLLKQGIEYWGCPMNGAFRYEPLPIFSERLANLRSWWKRCHDVGAAGMLITSWEAYRLALETTTVVDAAAATLWATGKRPSPALMDDRGLLTQGFRRVFGLPPAAARRHAGWALQADAYPFAGYAAWEVNDRWDTRAGTGATRRARTSNARLQALTREASAAVPSLAASLQFRSYLASRERFICEGSDAVFALRRKQQAGMAVRGALRALATQAQAFRSSIRAASVSIDTMWRCTRRTGLHNQNTVILAEDLRRLDAVDAWIARCASDPDRVLSPNPFCGAWQLVFTVHNFAPALQRVGVEALAQDGLWHELHGRHTIEFQAAAARERANIRRPFSVPVERRDIPLRIVLRGLGQVKLERVFLTNGIETVEKLGRRPRLLGRPAPRSGFPDIRQLQEIWEL